SGLLPSMWATAVTMVLGLLAPLGVDPFVAWLEPSSNPLLQLHVAVLLALCVAFTYAFARTLDARVLAGSAAFLVLIYAINYGARRVNAPIYLGALALVMGTAIVMDLVVEWRARA